MNGPAEDQDTNGKKILILFSLTLKQYSCCAIGSRDRSLSVWVSFMFKYSFHKKKCSELILHYIDDHSPVFVLKVNISKEASGCGT